MFTTLLPLLPVLLSLGIIISTRRTILALLSGALMGAVIYLLRSDDAVLPYLWKLVWGALANPWHYSALVFTILLGGFAGLLQAGGGLARLFQGVTTKRSLESRVMGLGFLCFFDGLANSLLLGRLVRPIADRIGVPRVKLAYLADTTSSAIACLAPVSTWIAMQIGLISVVLAERGIEGSPYALFLQSIPLNFYCLFSLLLAAGGVFFQRDLGGMAKAALKRPRVSASHSEPSAPQGTLLAPLFSVAFLLLSIPILYYFFSTEVYLPFSLSKLTQALGSNEGPKVFMISASLSLLVLFLLTKGLVLQKRVSAVWDGMRTMFFPLGVLLCAWLFSAVIKDLGLAQVLTNIVAERVALPLFPLLIFLLGCVLSFTTGTSWGTMALLFPLCFGMLEEVPNAEILTLIPLLCAAIFSGAVFGDHCSPYSDTTIVSSVAAGCDAYDHVRTQLPYALICGGLAAVFFLLSGIVLAA